mgnify:CR=1 FL=1
MFCDSPHGWVEVHGWETLEGKAHGKPAKPFFLQNSHVVAVFPVESEGLVTVVSVPGIQIFVQETMDDMFAGLHLVR